jgi:hypothetical protein
MKTIITSLLIKIMFVDVQTNETLPGVKVQTDHNVYYSNLDGYVILFDDEKVLDISYVSYDNIKNPSLKKDTLINLTQSK